MLASRPALAVRLARLARLVQIPAWATRLLLAAWLLAAAWPALAQQPVPVPPLSARVTDLTGTLDAAQRQALEASLAAIEQKKGSQVAVLMVPTTQPEPIEQYALRVAEQWKLGRGKASPGGTAVDDGVLVVVAKNDRKLRIEVGYGLEGAIPDAYAKRIVAETIAPRFKQGDFAGGLQAGVDELARLIDGEPLPAPWRGDSGAARADAGGQVGDDGASWLPLILVGLVFGFALTRMLGRFLGSGVGGAGAGLLASMFSGSLGVGLAVGVGVLLLLLIFGGRRRAYAPGFGRRRGGVVPIFFPGGFGGGGFGGGGWGGGGGGGFSGGGGGFGGGGASGDW